VAFLDELAGIEDEWRRLTQGASSSTNTWTDAYLAAFAVIRGLKIVSFDGGFKKLPGENTLIL
jgi:predicted nucleic acid-binding protein